MGIGDVKKGNLYIVILDFRVSVGINENFGELFICDLFVYDVVDYWIVEIFDKLFKIIWFIVYVVVYIFN